LALRANFGPQGRPVEKSFELAMDVFDRELNPNGIP